jgi:carbonic anhydrase
MHFCLFFASLAACLTLTHGGVAGWTYKDSSSTCDGITELCGPSHWSNLAGCSACNATSTSAQTPINIAQAKVDLTLTYPKFRAVDGGCTEWSQFSDDHAYEVSFADASCTNLGLTYKSISYTLLQIHFHSPAEHQIGGGYYDAEAHMVHVSNAGNILVLGVLLEESASAIQNTNNSFLNQFWKHGAYMDVNGFSTIPLNPYSSFLPASRSYYTYTGSLTTPPCTEGLTWIVFEQPIRISRTDINLIRDSVAMTPSTIISSGGNDNRPIQALNGRTVRHYTGTTTYTPTAMPVSPPTKRPTKRPTRKPTKRPF